ncbi:MAG: hypothetical protein OEZ34_10545 [Spirochaetia bacterium]|nr:hypothetical protein [Spirochaetia bacterium]
MKVNDLKIALYSCASVFLLLNIDPIYSNDVPVWHSTGDYLQIHIGYSSIVERMKKENSPDIKIQNAVLGKDNNGGIAVEIKAKVLKPQFRGTICEVSANLSIQEINSAGSSVKMNSARVKSCRTGRGSGMDSLVRSAAGIALKKLIPDMEKDIQKSINDVLVPAADLLKSKTGKKVQLDHAVHGSGVSLFLYTEKIIEQDRFQNIPYSVQDVSGCMKSVKLNLFSHPSGGIQEERLRVFIFNSDRSGELEARIADSVRQLHSERILPGTELYWNDNNREFAGKPISISFKLFSSPDTGKGAVLECGEVHFTVPKHASVYAEIFH